MVATRALSKSKLAIRNAVQRYRHKFTGHGTCIALQYLITRFVTLRGSRPLFLAYDYHFLLCSDSRAMYYLRVIPKI